MPNHLHEIIFILNESPVGAKHFHQMTRTNATKSKKNASPIPQQIPSYQPIPPHGTEPGSLSAISQNFSSVSTRKINHIRKSAGEKVWQRNFHDRIIRNQNELNKKRRYIIENPLRWDSDSVNPQNIGFN